MNRVVAHSARFCQESCTMDSPEFVNDSDDHSIPVEDDSVLDRIMPICAWNKDARSDLRRRLAKAVIAVQARFTSAQIVGFADDYVSWNCGAIERPEFVELPFLEEASRLDTAQTLALMLLLMDILYPLPVDQSDRTPSPDVPFLS